MGATRHIVIVEDEPDLAHLVALNAQLPLQNAQLQPERRILGFKPKLRLEWQESQSQNKTSRPIIARR
jgi:hypothetical protein